MATFDQLSDEQRAIVELVLQQGKSYDELSELLGMPEGRVRELARAALVDLAPISARGVDEDSRGQLADYVLGQQAGPEATATRGHLRRSEAARSWSRSLFDSLEQLYRNSDLPVIPQGERERGAKRPVGAIPPGATDTASATAGEAVQRRRILAAAGMVALLAIGILVWPGGLLNGGDEDEGRASSSSGGSEQEGRQDAGISAQTQGQAVIAEQGGKTQIIVTATGLKPSTGRTGYQVWLYNSPEDRRSLGATVTDEQGNLQSGTQLPAGYRRFRFIDVTSVTVQGENQQNFSSGPSVLRGLLELRDKPVTRGTGNQRITLLAEISLLPLPASGG
jgi:hypothetical protein